MPCWWFDSTLRTQYRRISPNLMIVDGERTGRRILALFLVIVLISALPVFSLADGEGVALIDSGSPEVSMMALRSLAVNEGISLTAAEGNSGQFGYNIEPYQGDFSVTYSDYTSSSGLTKRAVIRYSHVEPGSYSWTFKFDHVVTNAYWRINSTSQTGSYRADSKTVTFNLDISESQAGSVAFTIYSPVDSFDEYSDLTVLYERAVLLVPVEGISSGYTFNSGVKDDDDISARLDLATWDFGSQPAGNYIINIYTYGQNYDVDFDIAVGSDITQDRKVAVAKSNGLYTCLISHGGGDLVLEANFTYKKSTLNSPDIGSGSVSGSFYEGSGSVIGTSSSRFVSSGNWIFNITDVVAVPLDSAGLEQFGVFGPIVGFFRDQFANLKSFLCMKFDKDEEAYTGATSSELSQDITSTEQLIQQEHQFTESINTQITEQSSKVDPVTVLDGIEGSSSVFSSMLWVSSIVSSGIDSMGVFQFLIYVPMIMGIVTLVIGRGASIAGRRPRPQPVNVRKGK